MKLRLLLVLLVSLLLSNCTSVTYSVSENYAFKEESDEGLILISTRWEFTCPSPTILPSPVVNPLLQYKNGKTHYSLILKNIFIKPDFENPLGYFYIKANKAGQYKFDRIHYLLAGKSYEGPDFEIPFRVAAGKAVYLGEISIKVTECSYMQGKSDGKARFEFKVSDQWRRDRELMRARMKNIDPASVTMRILTPRKLNLYGG